MADRAALRAIRDSLPHTWHAFFARFGRLTPIQQTAIPSIVAGVPTLVCAPTASGKTEAVVAPLAERLLASRRVRGRQTGEAAPEALGLILISPTRALCNDLERRLRGPLERCGLRLEKKSGDSPTIAWDAHPEVLITTPESLDSLLCRHPKRLSGLQALVLDEVHLLDGTARGDQVRCLLERLARIVPELQRCGASATLPEAAVTAQRYLGEGAAATHHAGDPRAQRRVVAETVIGPEMGDAARVVRDVFREAAGRKVLVFANRRADTEVLGAILAEDPRLAGHVYVHHGSLARAERLRVEQRFRDDAAAICVATSTLEIGIDIGDVDRVVLLRPPPNVSALLQRVGRGNRKESTSYVVCVVMHDWDKSRVAHLLACAHEGRLFPDSMPFRPGIAAQQALSLLFQNPNRWISAPALLSRLPPDARGTLGESGCVAILDGLVEAGLLRRGGRERYVAEEEAIYLYDRGSIHSTISDSNEVEIVDETTGRTVGRARFDQRAKDAAARASHGDVSMTLSLGGRKREVRRMAGDRVVVGASDGVDEARFVAGEPPRYPFAMAQDLARFLGKEPGVIEAKAAGGRYVASHFLGTIWGRVFTVFLKHTKRSKGSGGDAFFCLLDRVPGTGVGVLRVPELGKREAILSTLRDVAEKDGKRLTRLLTPSAFGRYVPDEVRRDWLFRALRLDALADHLARVRFVAVESNEDEPPPE